MLLTVYVLTFLFLCFSKFEFINFFATVVKTFRDMFSCFNFCIFLNKAWSFCRSSAIVIDLSACHNRDFLNCRPNMVEAGLITSVAVDSAVLVGIIGSSRCPLRSLLKVAHIIEAE